MSLALTNEFRKFYNVDTEALEKEKARRVFEKVVRAPWMSSGLTSNNAFTTTLVLRTYGFLIERKLLAESKAAGTGDAFEKPWVLDLGITDIAGLAKTLRDRTDAPAKFISTSISDKSRALINNENPDREQQRSLKAALALDLRRLLQSGCIYDATKFPRASEPTKAKLQSLPTGYLLAEVNHDLLIDQYPDFFAKPRELTLPDVANLLATDVDNFAINEYLTSAAVVYWFVDGIERAKIDLQSNRWEKICEWAVETFNRERSLVLAEHDAMMDPIAMGMAACLCARLRKISAEAKLGTTEQHHARLPSAVELEHSIHKLFAKQAHSGIWPKYFPIFHYQEAGSNFCFTFELLEAVLCEFGGPENQLLDTPAIITGLEQAVAWCKKNRLPYSDSKKRYYTGWNSGGDIQTLRKEQPESWATAVVHMFLWELVSVLSQHIQRKILAAYQTVMPPKVLKRSALDDFLDIDLLIQGKPESLRTILKDFVDEKATLTELDLRRRKADTPLSALLFGPPGTSKTEVTKAIAHDLRWPLVQINPSDFLKGTLANVYARADEIFQDLSDLSAVVVFFDEMDALTQSRYDDAQLDTATQFLTTSMLPKLTELHDKGRVVFFMATNFQIKFDPALKRAGRFDLLLCMGPPKLEEKLERLHVFYGLEKGTDQSDKAVAQIRGYLQNAGHLEDALALYTFGEFKSFLKSLSKTAKTIGDDLEKLKQDGFAARVQENTKFVTLRINDLQIDVRLKELDSVPAEKLAPRMKTEIAKYITDRKASRRQY